MNRAKEAAERLLAENPIENIEKLCSHFIATITALRENLPRLDRFERLDYDRAVTFMKEFFDVRTLPDPTH